MLEMLESSNIAISLSTKLLLCKNNNLTTGFYKYMEGTIESFKLWSGTTKMSSKFSSAIIESPKGVFGVSLFMDNTSTPVRCKVRSPSYNNLM